MDTNAKLQELDQTFDFNNAFKINAFTMVNILINHVQHDAIVLTIDGDRKILAPSRDLWCITYREWSHQHAFSLCKNILGKKEEMYWTSREKAQAWLHKFDLSDYGYEALTQPQAVALLQEYLKYTQGIGYALRGDIL